MATIANGLAFTTDPDFANPQRWKQPIVPIPGTDFQFTAIRGGIASFAGGRWQIGKRKAESESPLAATDHEMYRFSNSRMISAGCGRLIRNP